MDLDLVQSVGELFDVYTISSVGCLFPLEIYLSRCLEWSQAEDVGVFSQSSIPPITKLKHTITKWNDVIVKSIFLMHTLWRGNAQ